MLHIVESIMRSQLIVEMAAAVAAFATALVVIWPMIERDRLTQRMKNLAMERTRLRAARDANLRPKERFVRLRPPSNTLVQMLFDRLGLRAMLETDALKEKLKMAGLRGQAPLVTYIFSRIVMPVALAAVALFYVYAIMPGAAYPPAIKLAMALGIGLVGFYLPNVFLENLVQRRQHAISSAFPDGLDMLLICVQAGMSIEAAFGKVAKEISGQSIELAEEFSLTTAELSFLQDRRQAYENLGKRTGLSGAKAIAVALIQAELWDCHRPGAAGDGERAPRSADGRRREEGRRIATQTDRPNDHFFLPVLFVVILGPALLQVVKLH